MPSPLRTRIRTRIRICCQKGVLSKKYIENRKLPENSKSESNNFRPNLGISVGGAGRRLQNYKKSTEQRSRGPVPQLRWDPVATQSPSPSQPTSFLKPPQHETWQKNLRGPIMC